MTFILDITTYYKTKMQTHTYSKCIMHRVLRRKSKICSIIVFFYNEAFKIGSFTNHKTRLRQPKMTV